VQALPNAGCLPVSQPPPAGRAAAATEFFGQQPPRASGSQDVDDATEGDTVRNAGAAVPWLRRLLRQLNGRILQDALLREIAHRRGSCWWTVDHAGWVVTLDSPKRQEFSGRTPEETLPDVWSGSWPRS
jgi:hypothetical protein